jgi:hypothetical protein
MSEAYQRSLEAERERSRNGDETYARERAVEHQQMLLRAEEERQASEALDAAAGADPEIEDESAAESERLARQNQTLAVSSTTPPAWTGGPGRALGAQPATTATSGDVWTPNATPTQVVVIVADRNPPGAAVDVTLPAGVEDAEEITRAGTPTQLLTGSAATAAMASLGVLAIDIEASVITAAGRAVLYLGERVVGYVVPGGQVLLAATTAYDLIHSGTQRAPGEAFVNADGQVQRYAPADDGGLVLQTQVPQQYDVLTSPEEDHTWVTVGRVTPMSDEERAQMLRPTTTPAQPNGPTVLPQPGQNDADRAELRTPGYDAQPGTPATTTTPGVAQDWRDLLIDQSNSDNNRDLAQQRYLDNPTLQDPSSLAGQTLEGVGTWGYPNTPRGASGADYAEQLHGVPAGLELNVGGTPNDQGVITGGAWLDGVEFRNGRPTLIDRKDWAGYPPLGENFWHTKTVEEATRQLNAAQQIGATVEWQFSTQAAADAVEALLGQRAIRDDARLSEIIIRVVPKQ